MLDSHGAGRLRDHLAVMLAGLVAMAGVGCGGGKGDVTGKITHNGKPVVCGTVSLVGSDGVPRTSEIEPDGSYIFFDLPTGPAKLTVISPPPAPEPKGTPSGTADKPRATRKQWFPISRTYQDPEQSGLSCVVKRGANEYNIVLERPAEADPPVPAGTPAARIPIN